MDWEPITRCSFQSFSHGPCSFLKPPRSIDDYNPIAKSRKYDIEYLRVLGVESGH